MNLYVWSKLFSQKHVPQVLVSLFCSSWDYYLKHLDMLPQMKQRESRETEILELVFGLKPHI